MKTEVDKLTETPGIIAAAKTEGGQTEVKTAEGDARRWAPLLEAARQVLQVADDDEVKIALDKYTVVVMRAGGVVLGVVVVKSHPIVKSLKRMLRRAFKRMGATVAAPSQRTPSIKTVAPTGPTLVPDPVPDPVPDTTPKLF